MPAPPEPSLRRAGSKANSITPNGELRIAPAYLSRIERGYEVEEIYHTSFDER